MSSSYPLDTVNYFQLTMGRGSDWMWDTTLHPRLLRNKMMTAADSRIQASSGVCLKLPWWWFWRWWWGRERSYTTIVNMGGRKFQPQFIHKPWTIALGFHLIFIWIVGVDCRRGTEERGNNCLSIATHLYVSNVQRIDWFSRGTSTTFEVKLNGAL